ncbi:hypothetical protein OAM69_02775 [bacterium]|nr:hypothetical protein [bacterium]
MIIRKYQEGDKLELISLWRAILPDDPPHNEPSLVLKAKLAVDDLIFVAEDKTGIVGACMVGYDGLEVGCILLGYCRNIVAVVLMQRSLNMQ